MPTIINAVYDEKGNQVMHQISIYHTDQGAKVGRWCAAPMIPDRCDTCFDPATLAHYPAEGYYEETAPDGEVWRFGNCHRCNKQGRG